MTICLPWPSADLSPNARSRTYHKAARAKKAARHDAWAIALESKVKAPESAEIAVHIEFHPPDARRRDRDNMVASMKAALDGVAQALGVDDHRFRLRPTFHPPRPPKGAVIIRMEAIT
jgi:Holliday junction resolvase RusA-like endonuclease